MLIIIIINSTYIAHILSKITPCAVAHRYTHRQSHIAHITTGKTNLSVLYSNSVRFHLAKSPEVTLCGWLGYKPSIIIIIIIIMMEWKSFCSVSFYWDHPNTFHFCQSVCCHILVWVDASRRPEHSGQSVCHSSVVCRVKAVLPSPTTPPAFWMTFSGVSLSCFAAFPPQLAEPNITTLLTVEVSNICSSSLL